MNIGHDAFSFMPPYPQWLQEKSAAIQLDTLHLCKQKQKTLQKHDVQLHTLNT